MFLTFQNINLYDYYLPVLTFLVRAHLTQHAKVSKLLDDAKMLPKVLALWVGRNNVRSYVKLIVAARFFLRLRVNFTLTYPHTNCQGS